jgi:peptidyl-prolyl cis-trans isomerase B (cyclophilin B)
VANSLKYLRLGGLLCMVISSLLTNGCNRQQSEFALLDEFVKRQPIDKTKYGWNTKLPKPPVMSFSLDKKYFWELQTNKGNLTIQLMPDVAPMHVTSTIYLTRLGFYNNTVFHRVISGFMAQGGDPLGAGWGGPGYQYGGEFSPNAKHDKAGVLSMANSGSNTDGSQFFLTFKATPFLDGKHTVFGQVTEGMETLELFESLGSRSGQTKEEIKIVKATIRTE